MHLLCMAALACAAAAWTETVAQATALMMCAVLGSWAIDAAEGFAALAWLGPAAEWSLTRHLSAAERGVLQVADGAWFFAATLGALSPAYPGCPLVVEGPWRRGILWTSYILCPGAFLAAGGWGTRRRKRR